MRRTLTLLATAGVLAAAAQAANVPAEVATKATAANVEFLEKGLSKTPAKNEIPTLKAVAMLIAYDAQEGKLDAKRDLALKVAEGVSKKAYPAALADAQKLAAAAGSEGKPVKLEEQNKFDLHEVMSCYRPAKNGGLNLGPDVKAYSKKLTAAEVDAAGVVGARNAAIAAYAKLMPPSDSANTPAKIKEWEGLAQQSEDYGKAVATEAAKGAGANTAKMQKDLKAMDANCNACHAVFRN